MNGANDDHSIIIEWPTNSYFERFKILPGFDNFR